MDATDLQSPEVRAAVSQVAEEYLRDPNITSVGIGWKEIDGEVVRKAVLKFTVGQKLSPEALRTTTSTRPIPPRIRANGIDFETDVVERSFDPQPIAVALEEITKSQRKTHVDPMAPGVSIGNVRITAGTLGCFVADAVTGEPLILSNWHVLEGDSGQLGDVIVQPGAFDDNRVAANGAGVLVRSFLGLAGDCALARPVGRGIDPTIVGLGVAVGDIGEPELDDLVVKSGRTTDVTFGRVTRIHTISKVAYGSRGEVSIGGFEIGPDPDRAAPNNEISSGGDSGSAWMACDAAGAATPMILGLHFAGESVEPAEFALACYATNVFEKLEVTLLPAEAGGRDERGTGTARRGRGGRPAPAGVGFDATFLPGYAVGPPRARPEIEDDYARTRAEETVRHYMHFSLAMSASRRFARWVAWNVDGGGLKRLPRTGLQFVVDPEYPAGGQVDDRVYSGNPLDRGHVARRADLLWGDLDDARRANRDSFFFTNITPQLDDFNQSSRNGVWGELEDAIFAGVEIDDLRLSVFGGPLFADGDLRYRGILVPRSFWKVVAYVEGRALRAKAFVLTQDDLEERLESLGLDEFKVFQVTLEDLATRSGLTLDDLTGADAMLASPEAIAGGPVRRIRSAADLV